MKQLSTLAFLFFTCCCASIVTAEPATPGESSKLTMVVMDPLAAPLSCPCVEGYAQRKYEELAQFISDATGKEVEVVFTSALSKALANKSEGMAHIIIGKESVIQHEGPESNLVVTPLARLTGKLGKTTQTGLFVVPAADPAKSVADLSGYRIVFGPAECEEKHGAPLALLKESGVEAPVEVETNAACSDGASLILELGSDVRAAAVISSYAAPLLEGCGTVKKGDLRVIGETKPVPFVTAFATDQLSAEEQESIKEILLRVSENPELCKAIESLIGFVPYEEDKAEEPSAKSEATAKEARGPIRKKKHSRSYPAPVEGGR